MKYITWKNGARWLPLPLLMLAVYFVCRERMEPFPLLLRAMVLVFGYVAALGDVREHRVPNRLVLFMLGGWVLVMVPQILLRTEQTLSLFLSGLLGAALAGGVLLTVYLLSHHGLGGGDVKFMTAAGLYLGFFGVLPTMLTGSLLAAIVGIGMITLKKMDRKGTLPLVPFLYVGIVLTVLFR